MLVTITLAQPGAPNRNPSPKQVLYFFSPHRCKDIDMLFLSKLRGRASILPILAK